MLPHTSPSPSSSLPLLLLAFLLSLLSLVCPALSVNFYGISPTCGPDNSFSVITINLTGTVGINPTIQVGSMYLDSYLMIGQTNTSLSFFSPKLNAGQYNIQLCVVGGTPVYNCSQVCTNNCTTITIGNTSNTTCTQQCSQQCVRMSGTSNCYTLASYLVYSIPAILVAVHPSVTTHNSNVAVYGKNFRSCGVTPTVRVQSNSASYDFPAWFNSTNQLVFYANKAITGTVSLSLDGQHFDSISATPLTLSASGSSSEDSESSSPGGPHIQSNSPLTVMIIDSNT